MIHDYVIFLSTWFVQIICVTLQQHDLCMNCVHSWFAGQAVLFNLHGCIHESLDSMHIYLTHSACIKCKWLRANLTLMDAFAPRYARHMADMCGISTWDSNQASNCAMQASAIKPIKPFKITRQSYTATRLVLKSGKSLPLLYVWLKFAILGWWSSASSCDNLMLQWVYVIAMHCNQSNHYAAQPKTMRHTAAIIATYDYQ